MANEDKELRAMQEILSSLQGMDEAARTRVLTYVFNRLSIPSFFNSEPLNIQEVGMQTPFTQTNEMPEQNKITSDIRSLKDIKKPSTSVEMAVLVAYYLEEIVTQTEKKSGINKSDITKYFKQAGYPLPSAPKMTLVHAKNAGYFESVGTGVFKLNPVGYNLATHTMGKSEVKKAKIVRKKVTKKTPAKKVAKKTVKKVNQK